MVHQNQATATGRACLGELWCLEAPDVVDDRRAGA
jgi:hypothetical protein